MKKGQSDFAPPVYRKFTSKGAFPNKGAPSVFWGVPCIKFVLAISDPKMVWFSFCKKPLKAEDALYLTISLLPHPAPLLEILQYVLDSILL